MNISCEGMGIVKDFRDFITRGNVVDLAVAVVFGVAFNAVITAMVTDIITPLIGIPGSVNFNSITYAVNGSTFYVGAFINALINFLTIAIVVFFFIVKPIERIQNSRKKDLPPSTKQCPQCLSVIPIDAKRCMYCTSKVK